mmetsp:Transcript_2793/g.4366  ORF Transcript_2793/g.4366 Transcript_2793/m.4366 type:complete len:221 (+) Transcript_2793:136-798(+)
MSHSKHTHQYSSSERSPISKAATSFAGTLLNEISCSDVSDELLRVGLGSRLTFSSRDKLHFGFRPNLPNGFFLKSDCSELDTLDGSECAAAGASSPIFLYLRNPPKSFCLSNEKDGPLSFSFAANAAAVPSSEDALPIDEPSVTDPPAAARGGFVVFLAPNFPKGFLNFCPNDIFGTVAAEEPSFAASPLAFNDRPPNPLCASSTVAPLSFLLKNFEVFA